MRRRKPPSYWLKQDRLRAGLGGRRVSGAAPEVGVSDARRCGGWWAPLLGGVFGARSPCGPASPLSALSPLKKTALGVEVRLLGGAAGPRVREPTCRCLGRASAPGSLSLLHPQTKSPRSGGQAPGSLSAGRRGVAAGPPAARARSRRWTTRRRCAAPRDGGSGENAFAARKIKAFKADVEFGKRSVGQPQANVQRDVAIRFQPGA